MPTTVLLAVHLALLGRGVLTSLAAGVLVNLMLLVAVDLDRPTRGFIEVPSTPLDQARASMDTGPAATGPGP